MKAAKTTTHAQKKWIVWTGRIISALVAFMLAMSATMKLVAQEQMVDQFVNHFGYAAHTLPIIGVLELACLAIYLVPRTAVLGGLLLAGYLGGAVATHVRVEESFLVPLLLGIAAWLALFLRDPRVRELIPFRKSV